MNQQATNGEAGRLLPGAPGSASPVTDDAWDAYNRQACGLHYIAHKMRRMEIALRAAAECIESNKRHLEIMGRHCTVGTGQVLDEIANVLRSPNNQAHPTAAKTGMDGTENL